MSPESPVVPPSPESPQSLPLSLHLGTLICLGPSSLQLCLGVRIPCLRLQPLIPGLHLGPPTHRLCLGSLLTWPIIPLAPLGSLIPPALPWSVVDLPLLRDSTPPALPHPSIPLAPSGFFPPAPPLSSVAPALPQSSGFLVSASLA